MIQKTTALILLTALFSAAAAASDADFNKALNAAGCLPARVETQRNEKDLKVYEVTCLGKPRRTLGVVCHQHTCSTTSSGPESGSDNEKQ